jgi:hypothetical protein
MIQDLEFLQEVAAGISDASPLVIFSASSCALFDLITVPLHSAA